jgi:hypothetical protein
MPNEVGSLQIDYRHEDHIQLYSYSSSRSYHTTTTTLTYFNLMFILLLLLLQFILLMNLILDPCCCWLVLVVDDTIPIEEDLDFVRLEGALHLLLILDRVQKIRLVPSKMNLCVVFYFYFEVIWLCCYIYHYMDRAYSIQ